METQTINELMFNIQRGQQSMNFFLHNGIVGTATAILQLYQMVCRLHKEHLLAGGEVKKLESFLKATGGSYDIYNIPFPVSDTGPDRNQVIELEKLRGQLDRMGIRYHVLPSLNSKVSAVQICVYRIDQQKFQTFFTDYLDQQLSGREMGEKTLISLTDKRASIVAIPGEAKREQIREDFRKLNINYACLPDLNVGNGQTQYLIANADMPKVRHWYSLYRESLLKSGKVSPEELTSMSLDSYQQTANRSAETYIQGADEEIKRALERYEGQGKGNVEEKLEALDSKLKNAGSIAFREYLQDNCYVPLSIDHETLVAQSGAAAIVAADPSVFACRIPGTYGKTENLLVVSNKQVFQVQDTLRARYIAFVSKEQKPLVLNTYGKPSNQFRNGEELYEYFDKVKSNFQKRELLQLSETAKTMIVDTVPKPAPRMIL